MPSQKEFHGMKIPHWLEGSIIAVVFALLIFTLKLSCPARTGEGCFADAFTSILFLPLPFIYKIFSNHLVLVGKYEIIFLLSYWAIVGLLIGLFIDIHKKK